jgi:hypothetical protein
MGAFEQLAADIFWTDEYSAGTGVKVDLILEAILAIEAAVCLAIRAVLHPGRRLHQGDGGRRHDPDAVDFAIAEEQAPDRDEIAHRETQARAAIRDRFSPFNATQ